RWCASSTSGLAFRRGSPIMRSMKSSTTTAMLYTPPSRSYSDGVCWVSMCVLLKSGSVIRTALMAAEQLLTCCVCVLMTHQTRNSTRDGFKTCAFLLPKARVQAEIALDALVPCRVVGGAPVDPLLIAHRGAPLQEGLGVRPDRVPQLPGAALD